MSTHSAVDLTLCLPLPDSAVLALAAVVTLLLPSASTGAAAGESPPFEVQVEIEETAFEVPAYKVTNNGSGMFWGSGSSQLVRIGDKLLASAFEAVPGCAPLNNARWALYERGEDGWRLCQRDLKERTREPSPLCVSHAGRLVMSVNPTLAPWIDAPPGVEDAKMAKRGGDLSHKWRGGPARPEFLEFDPVRPEQQPKHWVPQWQGEPKFTEHSYRTFAADGENGEFILFQNISYTHSEWALLSKDGRWRTGQLPFPKRTVDRAYTPYHASHARVNYPNVMLRGRAVHFVGHSAYNIWSRIDPAKSETWGRANWGGRFRKIHYAWTPDIATAPFTDWTVVDSTMDDGGTLCLGDCWLAPDGRVHVVWIRNPIHPRLRDQHVPDIKRDRHLCYGILKEGKVLHKCVVCSGGETTGPRWPWGRPRFHVASDHTLYIIYYLRGVSKETRDDTGNYAVRVEPDGDVSAPVRIPLERPARTTFFTATPRSGNRLTDAADLLIADSIDGRSVVRYARIRFGPARSPKVTITGKALALPGEGRAVELNAKTTDPQDNVASVEWHLPDGRVEHGASLRWTAPSSVGDRFVVQALATDKDGNRGRAFRTVSLPPVELAEPTGLVRVEAEAFTAQGAGKLKVCHTVNASGTSISYWHKDIGHWIEWELDVPADGRYELWMRYTTACDRTRRSLQIDGTLPNPACADIAIPTTGGWSGTEDNWRYLKLASPLNLSAGKRRLRMTNLADGLGVDFFALRALP